MTDRSSKISIHTDFDSGERFSFGAVVQKYRTKKNMNQPELARLLGTSRNTITNWETDKSLPAVSAIRELARLLDIPLYELFGLSNRDLPSSRETSLLRQYRALSPTGKNIADRMVDAIFQEESEARDSYLRDNYFLLPLESTPAAAGSGCAFVEAAPEYRFVKKNSCSRNADALIRISGASMEPLYHDGDLVYMKYGNSADDGDDVVCSTADGAVIKRLNGRKLYSLNKELPFGEKNEDDHVVILGIVLGIVRAEELPSESDRMALEEIRHEDILQFNKTRGKE